MFIFITNFVLLYITIKYSPWALLVLFLTLLPIIVLYLIQVKMKRMRHITLTFTAPDGTMRSMPAKIGFSWSIFFFGYWALIFRRQFMEFFILLFITAPLITVSQGMAKSLFSDTKNVGLWFGFVLTTISWVSIYSYFIVYGNKTRLRKLHNAGFSFDNGLNEDVKDIYAYIGVQQRLSPEELKPEERQGKTHTFVVPENQAKREEDPNDWSHLTMQDLKLLLKSEGVVYDGDTTKDELLELCDKHLRIEVPEKPKRDKFDKMTVAQLMDELENKKIPYKNNMTKEQLKELLKK